MSESFGSTVPLFSTQHFSLIMKLLNPGSKNTGLFPSRQECIFARGIHQHILLQFSTATPRPGAQQNELIIASQIAMDAVLLADLSALNMTTYGKSGNHISCNV
ncbi:hypothetical protein MN608_03729 [Microdochium nivale]|nr:hypothetical protein MN608_03729 [Microdochium nivale]